MNFHKNATVVVVHGAWADGSSWEAVIRRLQARGFNVVAAPIPLTSLSDDAAALKRTGPDPGVTDCRRACVCRCGDCYGE